MENLVLVYSSFFPKFALMIKKTAYLLFFITSFTTLAQVDKLANSYFRKGEFEKAASLYLESYQKQQHSVYVFQQLIKSWQALDAYKRVDSLLEKRLKSHPKQHFMLVEKGYNLSLQKKTEEAVVFYEKALKKVYKSPSRAYLIAKTFQKNHLLDLALESYLVMEKANKSANYSYQIAVIYGEKGDLEMMFDTYLNMVSKRGGRLANIQSYIGRYISDDSQDSNNKLFRKLLIKRLQQNPKDEWNKLLSWLFLKQKNYTKALTQEIAVHKRSQTDISGIIAVGEIAFNQKDFTATEKAFNYILENTSDKDLQINSHYYLLESKKHTQTVKSLIANSYQLVFDQYGEGKKTLQIQISYADFLTFHQNNPQKAIEVLKNSLKNRLSRFQKAEVKLLLADILVYTGKYNQALINYSQIQTQLKGHVLAQKARYKVAQTSYFKGDFTWANIQLKVLKRGTTKLIANDAIDLSLLIDDNIAQDSIQAALRSYAKADLLAYQNKNKEAIDSLSQLLKNHKGHPIEDEGLFKQAQLFELEGMHQLAEQNYLSILSLENNDILIDDALFYIAKLYDEQLNNPEKAKMYYEKIILEQASSIYLVPARKRFRDLRGDEIVP